MLMAYCFQEPHIERPEHENDYAVHYQPLPEPCPEEQDVHADHDDYQREHVKHYGYQISHPSFLLRAAEYRPPSEIPLAFVRASARDFGPRRRIILPSTRISTDALSRPARF